MSWSLYCTVYSGGNYYFLGGFMHPRSFAGVGGTILLIMGLLAFIPGLSTYPIDGLRPLNVETSYGYFFGLLAMNVVNKLTLVAFGIAGIMCARAPTHSIVKSINYSRVVFIAMGVLAIMGMFQATNSFFDLAPLWGNQIWFYGIFALCGGYCGYVWPKNHPGQVVDTTHDRFRRAA
jgi:hypothetical protein